MSAVKLDVYNRLDALKIPYRAMDHEAVHTMEDCGMIARAFNAVVPKNLFLTTRTKSVYYLLLMRPDAPFRTAHLSKQLCVSRLSFAAPDALFSMMRTLPGAISPMGLLFDTENRVRLAIDRSLQNLPVFAFHPCVNNASLSMTGEDFFTRYLPALGKEPIFVDIHVEE